MPRYLTQRAFIGLFRQYIPDFGRSLHVTDDAKLRQQEIFGNLTTHDSGKIYASSYPHVCHTISTGYPEYLVGYR